MYDTLPSFSVLDTLDTIRDASQDTPFLTAENIDKVTSTFDVVIKVMGKGNINGNIGKLDTDCDANCSIKCKYLICTLRQSQLVTYRAGHQPESSRSDSIS